MRHPSDTGAEQFVMRKCNTCGKEFLTATYHQHVTYEPDKNRHYCKQYYCSYACLNKHRDGLERRPTKNKAVMMCSNDGVVIKTFPSAQAAAMFLAGMGYAEDVDRIREKCRNGEKYHGFYFKYMEDKQK